MKKQKNTASESSSLRENAEKQFSLKNSLKSSSRSEASTVKLIHELEVYHIELELQNEELLLAEGNLKNALEKYRTLYDFAPMGYFSVSRDGIIQELNLSGAIMLGGDRSKLINLNIKQFLEHGYLPVFNQFVETVFESKANDACKVKLLRKENLQNRVLLINGVVDGNSNNCLITAMDVTENSRLQERLNSSEMQYRRLFETAKDGILILDAISGLIEDVNPYLMEMLGYERLEFLGKELWEIGVFKNRNDSKATFVELQNKKYIRFDDLPLETKLGKPINVEFVCNVYSVDNKNVIQCNIRDITQRVIAEKSLKDSEARLLELNKTKDKFFSIVTHDLRAPFNSIVGFSNLLALHIREKDYERSEEFALIIQKSSWFAMELLLNLIDWSRSQTGRMDFNPVDVEINSIINEVAQFSAYSAKLKSITIERILPHNATVFVDKVMISSVLRNLISNAVKYTGVGGCITISAIESPHGVLVSVSDNGIGIQSEAVQKLFRIDESCSTPGTQEELGTGLGLLLCNEFVLKHNGELGVRSEPGAGSKFFFTIPNKPMPV